jgi:hypothetical protein
VGRDELAIEKRKPAKTHSRNEMSERHLTGIGCTAEHALTEKGAPEPYPIESTDQRIVGPNFH